MCDYKSRQSSIQQNGLTFLYWIGFLEVEVEKLIFHEFSRIEKRKKLTNNEKRERKKFQNRFPSLLNPL